MTEIPSQLNLYPIEFDLKLFVACYIIISMNTSDQLHGTKNNPRLKSNHCPPAKLPNCDGLEPFTFRNKFIFPSDATVRSVLFSPCNNQRVDTTKSSISGSWKVFIPKILQNVFGRFSRFHILQVRTKEESTVKI